MSTVEWSLGLRVTKKDDDEQLVFGWLSVAIDKDGNTVVDSQGDIIDPPTLEAAAYDYVLWARKAGEMHERIGVGRLVESMVFTAEKCAAMGIEKGVLPIGWWVGWKIDDPDTWAKIRSGEYAELSLGGTAIREAA